MAVHSGTARQKVVWEHNPLRINYSRPISSCCVGNRIAGIRSNGSDARVQVAMCVLAVVVVVVVVAWG